MRNRRIAGWRSPLAFALPLVIFLAGCPKKDLGYQKSLYLSPAQKGVLAKLQKQSKQSLQVAVWPAAGTVSRLDLTVSSGAPAGASPAEQAQSFVAANKELWRLASPSQMKLGSVVTGSDCTTVNFQLVDPNGISIYNGGLAVGVSSKSNIVGVVARATGDPPQWASDRSIPSAEAKQILLKYLNAPGLILPEPAQVILDPFFLSNARHAAVKGWLFQAAPRTAASQARVVATSAGTQTLKPTQSEESGAESFAGPFVVNEQTGAVVVAGPSSQPAGLGISTAPGAACPGSVSSALPEVVVDPLTGSPSFVGLAGVSGVPTSGATDVDRAYSVFASPLIVDMYGDLAPREHLANPVVRKRSDGGTAVSFDQVADGVRVEGAALTVSLDSQGSAISIFGRVIYRPTLSMSANIRSDDAIKEAFAKYLELECGTDNSCRNSLSTSGAKAAPTVTQVVLSSRIFKNTTLPTARERLAWKIAFERRIVYWSANGASAYLFSYPTIFNHIPLKVYDFSQVDADGQPLLMYTNLPPGGGRTYGPLDPDATAIVGFMPTINAFYATVGRAHSFNNSDATALCVFTMLGGPPSTSSRAFWRDPDGPLGMCPGDGSGLFVYRGMGVNDVIAHEFTHAVTFATAGLVNTDEPGALGESYSDVMGELIFPDQLPPTSMNTWTLGESAPTGIIRDMKMPLLHGQPDNVGSEQGICRDPSTFTHDCDSIPNLAAARASDGIPGLAAPGIGQTKLKFLYYTTLTGGNPPASPALIGLTSSSRFLDQRVATLENCWSMVGIGPLSDGTTLTPDDCYHVADSFESVGITVTPMFGWTRFSADLAGTRQDLVAYAGLHVFNGCTISDVTIRGVDDDGTVMTSDITTGMTVTMNGWAANVTSRGSSTDPTDRQVNYHLGATWNHSGTVFIDETYSMPAGITSNAQCEIQMPAGTTTGPAPHLRTFYSTTLTGHWASFLNGERSTDLVNVAALMPAGCSVESMLGIQYDGSRNPVPPPTASVDNGGSGYTITSVALLPNGLGASVHTWHDGASGIFVRVAYNVWEPSGTDCSVPGSTQNND